MALTSSVSRAVEIIVSLKDKITAPAKKIANSFKNIGKNAEKNFKAVDKESKKATTSVKKLTSAAGSLANKLIGLASGFTVGAIINIAASFEQMAISLRSVTGSAEEADKQFEAIKEFASTVPLGVDELTRAFIKLQARGLEPSIEALESYGNTAAALGKTLDQFVEAVADAATFQFERLREFGVVARQSATEVAFTFQGVTTSVKKDAASIEGFLRGLGQTQFAGGLVNQMDTINGATSNLRDSFNDLAVSIADAGLAGTTKTAYRALAAAIRDISDAIKDDAGSISDLFGVINQVIVRLINGTKILFNSFQVLTATIKIQFTELFLFVNELLEKIPFGDIADNAEREVARLKLLNAELKLDRDRNIQDLQVAAERIGNLYKKQGEAAEEAADKTDEALDKQTDSVQKFKTLINELQGIGSATESGLDISDTFKPIQEAIESIDSGDFDGAISKTDQLVQLIRDMNEAGIVSKDSLILLTKRVQALQEEAITGKGLGTEGLAERAKQDAEQLKAAYDELGVTQLEITPELNTAVYQQQLEAIQAEPVLVPIVFTAVNNPNDVIYNEMVQRGDNG